MDQNQGEQQSVSSVTQFAFDGAQALRVKMADDALRFMGFFDGRMRPAAVAASPVGVEIVPPKPLSEDERDTYQTILAWVRTHYGSVVQGPGRPVVVIAPANIEKMPGRAPKNFYYPFDEEDPKDPVKGGKK